MRTVSPSSFTSTALSRLDEPMLMLTALFIAELLGEVIGIWILLPMPFIH
jgi:hypothetical protein